MTEQAIRIIKIMLGSTSSVTREQIEEKVDNVLLMSGFESCDRNQLIREIESIYNVRVEEFRIIEHEERRHPWLLAKRSFIDWGFWTRYKTYLNDEKNFAPDVISKLDRLTDRILDSLFDPTQNIQIDKKGLVVGQVQSGKTANYTGLICKAADAGYKLIIILAGIHNNLRSQTQLRIDEGFLGFDTQHTRAFNQNNIRIGVGRIDRDNIAHSLTSSLDKGDFTQGAANAAGFNFDTNEPIIAVVKKNPSVLKRIYQWLSAQAVEESEGVRKIRNKSLLLIDDEADHASINVSNDPDRRSAINGWITHIISLFGKSGYVGYTATPFANIFIPIEEDNLFPRDFIINIPAPSNYIGPERVFGFQLLEEDDEINTVLPIVNRADDYSEFVPDRHKINDPFPISLPESLKRAIRCFILTCAIRRLRGQKNVHNSMLIHVSRFQRWQAHITELVQNQFDFYRMGIDQRDSDILKLFRNDFEHDGNGYKSFVTVSQLIQNSPLSTIDPSIHVHTWQEVSEHLNDAASRIEVRAIFGGSRDALDYYDYQNTGLSVIAVGGNKLSRGLTLEGLSVSYYLRAAKMYDTLMQMGRWFGYRPGYVDLCRLFTSRELNEWFCHIAHASEELREEFDYMADVAGSTPEQYALKVRTHPGVLQISATNKLRSAVTVQITWAGRLVESYEFKKDPEIIRHNIQSARRFIAGLPDNYRKVNNNLLWFDIQPHKILEFLGSLKTLENMKAYDPQNLVRFINLQLTNNELTSWRVALMSKSIAEVKTEFIVNNSKCNIGCMIRRQDTNNSDQNVYYLRKSHIISPRDEFIDLTSNEYERAMQLTQDFRIKHQRTSAPNYPSGEIVRNETRNPQNPLLLLYILDPSGAGMPQNSDPFVGYAISFPGSDYNAWVAYAVHEQLLDRFNIEDETEDFDDEED
jgi:hypothetical protein